MPYKLRKAPNRDLYWVVNTETKKKHSNDPLPKDRAEAQMRALYAAEKKEGKGKQSPLAKGVAIKQQLLADAATLKKKSDEETNPWESMNLGLRARDTREHAARLSKALPGIAEKGGRPKTKPVARVSPLGPPLEKVGGPAIKAARLLKTPKGQQQAARLAGNGCTGSKAECAAEERAAAMRPPSRRPSGPSRRVSAAQVAVEPPAADELPEVADFEAAAAPASRRASTAPASRRASTAPASRRESFEVAPPGRFGYKAFDAAEGPLNAQEADHYFGSISNAASNAVDLDDPDDPELRVIVKDGIQATYNKVKHREFSPRIRAAIEEFLDISLDDPEYLEKAQALADMLVAVRKRYHERSGSGRKRVGRGCTGSKAQCAAEERAAAPSRRVSAADVALEELPAIADFEAAAAAPQQRKKKISDTPPRGPVRVPAGPRSRQASASPLARAAMSRSVPLASNPDTYERRRIRAVKEEIENPKLALSSVRAPLAKPRSALAGIPRGIQSLQDYYSNLIQLASILEVSDDDEDDLKFARDLLHTTFPRGKVDYKTERVLRRLLSSGSSIPAHTLGVELHNAASTALKQLTGQAGRAQIRGRGFTDIFERIKKTATGAFSLATKGIRQGYSPSVKKMLGQFADAQIVELAVRRDPIEALLDTALNAITLGKWSSAKRDLSYDKLFHLGLVVGVKKGGRRTNLIVEKNEVVNIAVAKRPNSKTEFYHVPLRGKQMLFGQFMDNAEQASGPEFFLYDAFENNCQDFVLGLLKANGVLDENAATFIKQPVDQLIKKLPSYTQKIARKITDLGAAANVVLEGEGLRKLLEGAGVGHVFETRFNPKSGFFHRPFEPMAGAGNLFFLKGKGSDRGRYFIDPKLTIPDLADFLNQMTAPNEIEGILLKLESATEMGFQERGRTPYNFLKKYEVQAMETADALEKLVNEQYDQSMEMLNAFRSGKPEGLGQLVNAIGQGIAVFRTLKRLQSPTAIIQFGAESLGALLDAAVAGNLNRVAPQVSYSYGEQLQSELSAILGPAGQLGAQIAGVLGELFGAKSQAQRNDPYVESVIRAKRDEALPLIREFRQRWQENLKQAGEQEAFLDKQAAVNQRENDLHSQYVKDVFWMDRMTPAEWADRFDGEVRPAARPYVSFESWKAKKGYGRGDIVMKRKDFVAEHKKLISLLGKVCKEGKEQSAELQRITGGIMVGGARDAAETRIAQILALNPGNDRLAAMAETAYDRIRYYAGLRTVARTVGSLGIAGSVIGYTANAMNSTDAGQESARNAQAAGAMGATAATAAGLIGMAGSTYLNAQIRNTLRQFEERAIELGARIEPAAAPAAAEEPVAEEAAPNIVVQPGGEPVLGISELPNASAAPAGWVPAVRRAPAAAPSRGERVATASRMTNPMRDDVAIEMVENPLRAARTGSGKGIVFRSLEKSNKAGKKWQVNLTVNGRHRVIHFGAAGMDDFTKTHDNAQKKRYIERHQAREDWTKKGVLSAGFWSRHLLWGPKESVAENLSILRKKFNL